MTTPNVKQILDLPEKLVGDLTGNESLEMQDLGGGPGSSKRIQLQSLIYRFGDVPNDGVIYARKNRAWFALTILNSVVLTVNGQAPVTGAVTLPASAVPYTPVGSITATNVQTAVAQVAGSIGVIPIKAVTTTAYTLAIADAGVALHVNNAALITLTIPTNATVAYPIGFSTLVRQVGVGAVSIVVAAGVTLRNGMTTSKTAGQYTGSISLHKIGTDEWYLDGYTST